MASLTPRLDKLDKNYIINGNFDYWQRNTTGNITGAVVAVDRFTTNYNAGAAGTISRSTDVPDLNSTYSAQVDVTTGINAQIAQRIESIFAKDLANKTITLKFKVKAVDATGRDIRAQILTPNVTDNWSAETIETDFLVKASPTAGEWVTYSTIISIPAAAVRGLRLLIYRAGASATTSTRYSQIQIMLGENTNTDFCYAGRDVLEELDLCRRYFEKTYDIETPVGSVTTASQLRGYGPAAYGSQPLIKRVNNAANPWLLKQVGTNTTVSSTNGNAQVDGSGRLNNGSVQANFDPQDSLYADMQVSAAFNVWVQFRYRVAKRVSPNVTIYNPNTGGTGTMYDPSGNVAASTDSGGRESVYLVNSGAARAGTVYSVHATADAEL